MATLNEYLEQNYTLENLDTGILNSLDAFVFIFDVIEAKPIWINDYFYRTLNYSKEDFLQLTAEKFLAMLHPNSQQKFKKRMHEIIHHNNDTVRSIYQIKTKDNQWVYMLLSSRILHGNGSDSKRYLLGFATLIEKSELNKQLILMNKLDSRHQGLDLVNRLSSRELDVVRLITRGNTDKEIAEKLQISIHTTKTHRKRIISKLGLKNTAALVKFAVENGIS